VRGSERVSAKRALLVTLAIVSLSWVAIGILVMNYGVPCIVVLPAFLQTPFMAVLVIAGWSDRKPRRKSAGHSSPREK